MKKVVFIDTIQDEALDSRRLEYNLFNGYLVTSRADVHHR